MQQVPEAGEESEEKAFAMCCHQQGRKSNRGFRKPPLTPRTAGGAYRLYEKPVVSGHLTAQSGITQRWRELKGGRELTDRKEVPGPCRTLMPSFPGWGRPHLTVSLSGRHHGFPLLRCMKTVTRCLKLC